MFWLPAVAWDLLLFEVVPTLTGQKTSSSVGHLLPVALGERNYVSFPKLSPTGEIAKSPLAFIKAKS